jgi:hypothetical protein
MDVVEVEDGQDCGGWQPGRELHRLVAYRQNVVYVTVCVFVLHHAGSSESARPTETGLPGGTA